MSYIRLLGRLMVRLSSWVIYCAYESPHNYRSARMCTYEVSLMLDWHSVRAESHRKGRCFQTAVAHVTDVD